MAVDEHLYRKFRDAGFTHTAALTLSDDENTSLQGGSLDKGTVGIAGILNEGENPPAGTPAGKVFLVRPA